MLCLLPAFSLCLWCVVFECGSISRFKGVFSAVWGCCVGLSCLRALLGLCGFCARVELGGFMACCVFAFLLSVFLSLSLFLSSCPCLSVLDVFCLSSCLDFPLLLCLCVFFFPIGLHAKRKGAKVLPLSVSDFPEVRQNQANKCLLLTCFRPVSTYSD